MTGGKTKSDPVVLAVTDRVPNRARERYESLVRELHGMLRRQPGFLSADTVRHAREQLTEYTVLLRFKDRSSAEAWKSIPALRSKLDEVCKLTGGPARVVEAAGLEMWVDHPPGVGPALPAYWKRVSLSVLAVYPSLLLLMAISRPLIGSLTEPLQVLIIVVVLSGLLTWPIMPLLTRVLRSWLTPASA